MSTELTEEEKRIEVAAIASAALEAEDLHAGETEEEKEERERLEREAAALSAQEEEVVVSIGDEEQEQVEAAPEWVRELRKANRELKQENKQLKHSMQATPESAVVVGKKPEMSDPDIDYDAEAYQRKYDEWNTRKRQADDAASAIETEQGKQAESWQKTVDNYGESRESLKVPDYADAEEVTKDALSETQQNVLMHGATNPALVVYALGKNPAKAKELGAIADPIKFAFAVSKLEAQLKMTKRKPASKPESSVNGTGAISGATDSKLERLEKEAERTGDRTKVIEHNRKKRANG